MKKEELQRATIFSCSLVLLSVNPALAGDSVESQARKQISRTPLKLAFTPDQGTVNTDLSAVRDWGLINRQMKEQAMNLYLEATRFKPTAADSCEINVPAAPSASTPLDSARQLPPRTEWVAYYLNSMEPLMQYVASSLRASEGGKLQVTVPKGAASQLGTIANKMYSIGHRLDKYLDQLKDIFSQEQPSADQLRDVATKIFDDASKLEELRCQYYEIIRNSEKSGVKETEILPPLGG